MPAIAPLDEQQVAKRSETPAILKKLASSSPALARSDSARSTGSDDATAHLTIESKVRAMRSPSIGTDSNYVTPWN